MINMKDKPSILFRFLLALLKLDNKLEAMYEEHTKKTDAADKKKMDKNIQEWLDSNPK